MALTAHAETFSCLPVDFFRVKRLNLWDTVIYLLNLVISCCNKRFRISGALNVSKNANSPIYHAIAVARRGGRTFKSEGSAVTA